jgi:succinate dehydrogenase / fumarate reductase cytochrome b subunit
MHNHPHPTKFWRWFDFRRRKTGSYAFILNRVTAIGLTLYLILHLVMLGNLAIGAEAYDNFIAFAHNPIIKIGEMLVIVAGCIHGLNGIRIALTSFGIGVRFQKQMFFGSMTIALIIIFIFAYFMFSTS